MTAPTQPVDLAEVVAERLRTEVPVLAKSTKGAVDFAALVASKLLPPRLPAAFVIAPGLVAQGTRRMGAVSHDIEQEVGVVLIQGHAGDATADRARAAVWPLELEVIDALVGWSPAPGYAELLLVGDQLQGLGGEVRTGAVACTITFSTTWKLYRRTGK